jgi:hypothetical protein
MKVKDNFNFKYMVSFKSNWKILSFHFKIR